MGKNTQQATLAAQQRADQEIKEFFQTVIDGTATEQDVNDFMTKALNLEGNFAGYGSVTNIKGALNKGTQSLDLSPDKLQENPVLNYTESFLRSKGALPPTGLSELQDLLTTLNLSAPEIVELQKALTQGEFDVSADNVGRFAELNAQTDLNILDQFGEQFKNVGELLDPESSELQEELAKQVFAELQLEGQLSPDQNRLFEQAIQSAQTSRGTPFGNSAVSAEALSKGTFSEQLKAQRQNSASQLLQLRAQTRLDPISTLLGRQVVRSQPNTQFGQSFQGFSEQSQAALGTVPFNQQSLAQKLQQDAIAASRARRDAKKDSGSGALIGAGLGGIIGALAAPATGGLSLLAGGLGGAAKGASIGSLIGN